MVDVSISFGSKTLLMAFNPMTGKNTTGKNFTHARFNSKGYGSFGSI
jgi:hypothetical protein